MRHHRLLTLALPSLLFLLLTAACSGGDGRDDEATTTEQPVTHNDGNDEALDLDVPFDPDSPCGNPDWSKLPPSMPQAPAGGTQPVDRPTTGQ